MYNGGGICTKVGKQSGCLSPQFLHVRFHDSAVVPEVLSEKASNFLQRKSQVSMRQVKYAMLAAHRRSELLYLSVVPGPRLAMAIQKIFEGIVKRGQAVTVEIFAVSFFVYVNGNPVFARFRVWVGVAHQGKGWHDAGRHSVSGIGAQEVGSQQTFEDLVYLSAVHAQVEKSKRTFLFLSISTRSSNSAYTTTLTDAARAVENLISYRRFPFLTR